MDTLEPGETYAFQVHAPILLSSDKQVGVFSIADQHPRIFSETEQLVLGELAALVADSLSASYRRRRNDKQTIDAAFAEQLKRTQQFKSFSIRAAGRLQTSSKTALGLLRLAMTTQRPEQRERYLQRAFQTVDQTRMTTSSMLAIAESDEVAVQSVDIERVIERVRISLRQQLSDSSGLLRNGDLPRVWADERHLATVITHLVQNGLRLAHPDRPPTIDIDAVIEGSFVRLTLKDNSRGISEQEQQLLFEPFVGADDTGAGLELFLCRELLYNQGARINLVTSSDQGTSFELILRCATANYKPSDTTFQQVRVTSVKRHDDQLMNKI